MLLHHNLRRLKTLARTALGLEPMIWRDVTSITQRFGSDYGGWNVMPALLSSESIVYSFGIGEDISFDTGLIAEVGATVHAFDPTPKSLDWIRHQRIPSALIVHDYGIAGFDGTATFYPPENDQHVSHTVLPRSATEHRAINVPVKKLSTIMQTLGHECIDLLKMDIEGAEYEVITDIMSSGIRPRQLLVEFHHRFPGVSIRDTRKAVSMLRDCGYAVFWISPSNEEYGFVYTNGR